MISAFLRKYRFELKLFILVWLALVITFSFCNVTFFVSNHDYRYLRNGMSLGSGVWEGRLTQFVFSGLLSGNQILPIINIVMAFVFYAASGVLLAWWYGLDKRMTIVLPFVLFIELNPYILSQIFYTYTIISIGCWHFFAILGTILIYSGVRSRRLLHLVLGGVCLCGCFSGYAPSLQLVLTVLAGKFILDATQKQTSFKAIIKIYVQCFLVILIAASLVFAIISFLKEQGLVFNMYNVKVLSFDDIIRRLGTRFFEPWKTMFMPLPHCPVYLSFLFMVLFVIAFSAQRTLRDRIIFMIFLPLLGIAMSVSSWLSPTDVFRYYRINSFSYPYVTALMFALIVCRGLLWQRNVAWGMVCAMLFFFVRADFTVQKIWYLGSQQDGRILERVRKDIFPYIIPRYGYRLATLGELNGQAKFAQKRLLSDYFDYTREYGYYATYLPIFFSHALFITEPVNQVIGDANYFCCTDLMYLNNNEHLSSDDKARIDEMLYGAPRDLNEVYEALETMRIFLHNKYYFVGQRDIIIRFSDDVVRKILLHQEMY